MEKLIDSYIRSKAVKSLLEAISSHVARIRLKGVLGSLTSLIAAATIKSEENRSHVFVLPDKETAAYFYNDLGTLFHELNLEAGKRKILFYPASYKKPYQVEEIDNANILLRSDVLNRLQSGGDYVIVTFPEALSEKVISQRSLAKNILAINLDEKLSDDFVLDVLAEYGFERVDFVIEPGQFALRGGIIDVFSYAHEFPFRIEFSGETVESLRTFDPVTQLSKEKLQSLTILPNICTDKLISVEKTDFLAYLPNGIVLWFENLPILLDAFDHKLAQAQTAFEALSGPVAHSEPKELYSSSSEFLHHLTTVAVVEFGSACFFEKSSMIEFNAVPQPVFNKKFDMLVSELSVYTEKSYVNYICVENEKQAERLKKIFSEISSQDTPLFYNLLELSLNEGFIDHSEKILCFTDHQIFERYHKYQIKDLTSNREVLTLKELFELKPGDFVTHVDHGVGRFGGLEKIENNGKIQEAIRLIYKDNDILYVSIHSLHRISRYIGKEGSAPTLNKLGSNTWQALKNKTKQKVKDIAKDLIKLYAQRKANKGFAFSADTYLQNELEASFMYEDTPDQMKATQQVKRDMEASNPMDRLICGDVGFGKTEVAMRAAFKAVTDSKQAAVLVPTTILALQHFNTFSDRLKNFPCRIEYLNRFRSAKDKAMILKDLENGKIDILIGTHAITSKQLVFKDLGLLIIDEEQKFGVTVKERIKQMKINVDTLTLTATPIPRTLQFSLMGARDLSVISTPPPNRYPVQTELHVFSEEVIRDAILFEISRGGQVYFVHNRVQSIQEMAGLIQQLLPDAKIAVGHGQMEGNKLESVLLQFINGEFDVLVATTIIENGLDIPNANTIIINDAQNFGLSELHQLRGRVGRSNKKSFCYLFTPSFSVLTDDARKRLKAIEEFSAIGSGFNIAMRDLDIRGAGNILGAEQSGFISEIGFDMYQKILNEAIEELKETDFKELYHSEYEKAESSFVSDCAIETDLEILIPDDYVSSATERLLLYKELDGLETDQELELYKSKLNDRFGPIPQSTMELVETIKLRRLAKRLGFEKLILKQSRLIAQFIANQDSPYYSSPVFSGILQFIQKNPSICRIREGKDKLTLTFDRIDSINNALKLLSGMEL